MNPVTIPCVQAAVCRVINALQHHLPDCWREHLIAECGLKEKDLPYHPVYPDPSMIYEIGKQEIQAITDRVTELEAQIDLNRDEFLRIKLLAAQIEGLRANSAASRFALEIVGLCDRSQQVIRQRVPLIQQLDNATKEAATAVARMHDAESEICMMQAQIEALCAERDLPKIDAGRLIRSLPPDVNKKVSLHDLKRICDNYNRQKVIQLSSGATATVSRDCPPEAIAGLEEMARLAAKAVRDGTLTGDASPSLPSAGTRFLKFAAEIQRISNDFIPSTDEEVPLALAEMREALNYALENAELV